MLFVLLSVSSVFFGFCVSEKTKEVCYGKSFNFPFLYTPPLYTGPLYFTPRDGGPNKILMDNGKSLDQRIYADFYDVLLRDVREDDEGSYFTSSDGRLTLKVLDCAEEITRQYLDSFEHRVPSQAYFLEFSPVHNRKQINILWNRTNHDAAANIRRYVKNSYLSILRLTQKDDGYYNLREKHAGFLSRIRLIVQEHTRDITVHEKGLLEIVHPWLAPMKTMTFTPVGEDEPISTMRDGVLVRDYWFNSRIQAVTNGIKLFRVQSQDSGTYHFKDSEDNLIMTVHLKVNDDFIIDTLSYLSVGLLFPGIIILCCCSCFIKKHYKQYHSAPQIPETTPAPPAVYYHGINKAAGQIATPSSTVSYQPVHVPKAPTVTPNPPVYQPVSVHVAPTQLEMCEPMNVPTQPQVHQPADIKVTHTKPEVAPSQVRESTAVPPICSNALSADMDPTFKLKGVTFTSASPLTSDSTHCDVYTSDKFNFL